MGITAMALLSGSEGGIGQLQSFIVVTAVPVSLLLLPSVGCLPSSQGLSSPIKQQRIFHRPEMLSRRRRAPCHLHS